MGLFVGLVVSLFSNGSSAIAIILGTMLFGAIFGLVWALAGYAATRGRRDFTSVTQVVATRYEVLVEHKFAEQGRQLLAQNSQASTQAPNHPSPETRPAYGRRHYISVMRQPSITIIGAGFGGLGTAIELKRAGYSDITVLEKADGVGGVWRENTYPNAACDVPSSLYSWSFAPNPDWPHRYSRQDEILAYIERTAREQGVLDLVRTGVEVTSAAYDESNASWHLETATGEQIDTDVLVTAVGQLSRPSIPELPGLGTFEGPAFHSAEWDHSADLRGKRIAVLGTGASAIQFVPGIQPEAGHVTVFQRSAPYVAPKPDREYTRTHGKAFRRFPRTQAFGRGLTWRITEQFNKALIENTPLKKAVQLGWKAQLHRRCATPSCARSWSPTTSSAASGCCSPTTGTPRWPSPTSTWSPSRSSRCSRRACAAATAWCTRST